MIIQVLIALLGIMAVWLSQDARHERRRFACIFGLLGQPLWFYTTWQAGQWGIFVLSFAYTFAWIKGVRVYWLDQSVQPEKGNPVEENKRDEHDCKEPSS